MRELTAEVLQYLQERGWDKVKPSDFAKSVSIEAAELLEIFQWSSPTAEETKANPEKLEKLKGELADVLLYVLDICAVLDIDAEEIIRTKLEKVKAKYPAELFKDLKPEEQGNTEAYWQIKSEHRRKEA